MLHLRNHFAERDIGPDEVTQRVRPCLFRFELYQFPADVGWMVAAFARHAVIGEDGTERPSPVFGEGVTHERTWGNFADRALADGPTY
jgi:hypothetical protein